MPLSIILVEPEIPENIGFVARTMNCYRLADLRLVKTRKLNTQSKAYKTGTKGRETLSKAQYFSSVSESLHDIHLAIGFTRRKRSIQSLRVTDISETITSLSFKQNVALIFGKESQGLSKSDCDLMSKLIFVDLPNADTSLNLSHCVTVALHEIYYHSIKTYNPLNSSSQQTSLQKDSLNDLTVGNKDQTLQKFIQKLDQFNLFKANKKGAHLQYIQDLWHKADPNQKEMDFLIGLVKKILAKK